MAQRFVSVFKKIYIILNKKNFEKFELLAMGLTGVV